MRRTLLIVILTAVIPLVALAQAPTYDYLEWIGYIMDPNGDETDVFPVQTTLEEALAVFPPNAEGRLAVLAAYAKEHIEEGNTICVWSRLYDDSVEAPQRGMRYWGASFAAPGESPSSCIPRPWFLDIGDGPYEGLTTESTSLESTWGPGAVFYHTDEQTWTTLAWNESMQRYEVWYGEQSEPIYFGQLAAPSETPIYEDERVIVYNLVQHAEGMIELQYINRAKPEESYILVLTGDDGTLVLHSIVKPA